jgi:membrane associated rhomboid family serine protease
VIPLRDDNPTRTTPYITYAIVAANIIVFLYNGTLSGGHNPLAGYELVPASLFSRGVSTPISPWLTIFTAMFLHANLLHIGGNMLYLWIFGNNIEDVLGHFKFLIFYLLAGFGAAMAQVLLSPMSTMPMVGASGAIAGVLGAYLILFPRARVSTLLFYIFIQVVELPASVLIGWWILIQVVSTALAGSHAGGGVAYAAHVGGFATGCQIILIMGGQRLLRRQYVTPRYRW